MTSHRRFSLAAYRALLRLYPSALRREFGTEMLEMFAYDLAAAPGFRSSLHLWRVTLRETLHVVLPECWETPEIVVPFLTTIVVLLANSPAIVVSVQNRITTPRDALIGFSALCLMTALTAFLAVCRWMRSGLTTLRLT